LGITQTDGDALYGISLYGGPVTNGAPTYGILFAHTSKLGKINNNNSVGITSDWATYLTMSNTETRGWIFRRGTTNVAGIDGRGTFVTSANTSTHLKGLTGESVAINMTSGAGYLMLARIKSTDGRFNLGVYNHSFDFIYGADTVTSNTYTHAIALLNQNGVSALKYLIVDGANHLNSTESAPATGAKLRPGSTSYFIGDMILKGNLLPETDVTYDLGNTTYRWRDIYSHTLRL